MSHPLSIQLYTVRDAIAQDRDGVLRRIADIGFGAVEPYDPTNDPAGFRKVADDLGLAVSSTHGYAALESTERAIEVFEAAHTIGTDYVIIPGGLAEDGFLTAEGIDRHAERLNALSALALEHGSRIGYHNHWWEIEPAFDGRHALELLADRLAPEVFLEIDTYWAQVGGADVPALLGRLGDRIHALHVKDGPAVKGQPMVAAGGGAMDIPAILGAVSDDVWRIVELDECATDMFEALAGSHAYLTGLATRESV